MDSSQKRRPFTSGRLMDCEAGRPPDFKFSDSNLVLESVRPAAQSEHKALAQGVAKFAKSWRKSRDSPAG
jgi:hypothetical protein